MINLSESQKKIIFIVFFVAFTLGTGYALYYFFFQPAPSANPSPEAQPVYSGTFGTTGEREPGTAAAEPGTAPLPVASTAPGALTAGGSDLLRNDVTQALSISGDSPRYYNPSDGKFYKLNAAGEEQALSNKQFLNVDNISWANTGNEAILEFPDGSNIYYNFDQDRQVTLPSHWQDFTFSPNDNHIVAKSIGLDQNNRFLITASADGNEVTALYSLGANADRIIPSWSPNNTVIGFSKTGDPQPDNGEEIVLLGKNHEQLKSLKVAGKGFLPSWSPSGKQLLYSVYHERDSYKPMLWISDASGANVGQNRRKLNIQTWADKCAWADEQTIYCGVPISLPAGAALDRSAVSSVTDDIYRIDLTTGIAKKINTATNPHAITHPVLNAEHTELIYTDAQNGRLYKFNL